MSPRVYSAYVRLFQKYSRLYRGIQPQKSFPSLFNPSPRRVFLSFFFSLFSEKWSRILYIHRSFQEWILTYKTPSTEACIPRNKRVSPFPPDGYKDLTISNSEGRDVVAKIVSGRVHGERRRDAAERMLLVARYRNDGGRECSGRKSLLTAIRKK